MASSLFARSEVGALVILNRGGIAFPSQIHFPVSVLLTLLLFCSSLSLAGCSEDGDIDLSLSSQAEARTTSGPAYTKPAMAMSPTNIGSLEETGYFIDVSTLSQGYVSAAATSSSRLKFKVALGDMDYNYDLPSDGSPIICPLNMGNGSYTFSIWENTSGDRYVALSDPTAVYDAQMNSEFEPFIRPSFFCLYTESSACVKKANDLCANAENQAAVVSSIYEWIIKNVDYDSQKASSVASGYIPNPDSTLQSGSGICFDYASLAAAMLRSQGIPCKIMTGYVSPDNIYHAWNMVYIDGTWETVSFVVSPNTWTRIDTTFAAGDGGSGFIGDGTEYTDRYTY